MQIRCEGEETSRRSHAAGKALTIAASCAALIALVVLVPVWLSVRARRSTLRRADTVQVLSAAWLPAGSPKPWYSSRPRLLKVVVRLSRSDGLPLSGVQGVRLVQTGLGKVLDWGTVQPASQGYQSADYVILCDPAVSAGQGVRISIEGCALAPTAKRPWWQRYLPGYAPPPAAGVVRYPLINGVLAVPPPDNARPVGARRTASGA